MEVMQKWEALLRLEHHLQHHGILAMEQHAIRQVITGMDIIMDIIQHQHHQHHKQWLEKTFHQQMDFGANDSGFNL